MLVCEIDMDRVLINDSRFGRLSRNFDKQLGFSQWCGN